VTPTAGRVTMQVVAGIGTVLTVVVVAVLAVVGWLLWPAGDPASYRPAEATVVEAAACGSAEGRDVVRVDLGPRTVRAELDGCGHRRGEVLVVEVPVRTPAGGLTVRMAGTGVDTESIIEQRLAAVLAMMAGAAGALLAWQLRDRQLS